MLDEFRSTLITWDKATSRIYSPVTANESDENGRKLVVQIVNGGQVEDLTGATLHLYWITRDKAHDGLDVFDAVDLKKGEFELSYTTGMLSNQGALNANLVLIDTVGRVVSERFKITVTEGIDNDAIQSENSFSSLTQALVDISNLEQNYAPRLNDLTAQLQQTIKQGEASVYDIDKNKGLIDETFLSDTLKQQMAGTTPVNAIPSDYSLTEQKFSFPVIKGEASANLFNKETAIPDSYINASGGLSTNADWYASDFIPVESGKNYYKSTQNSCAFYDETKTFILFTAQSYTVTAPQNARYVRLTINQSLYYDIDNYMFNEGSEEIPYVPFGAKIRKSQVLGLINTGISNNTVVVSQTGGGDFTTITEAVNSITDSSPSKRYTIMIMAGTYEEQVSIQTKHIDLVALNLGSVTLISKSGQYDSPPLEMSCLNNIKNLILIATEDNKPTEYTGEPAYAIHHDYVGEGENYIDNCKLISSSNAPIGIGTHQSQKITMRNCEVIMLNQNGRPALLYHPKTTTATGQKLTLDNCRMRSPLYTVLSIIDSNNNGYPGSTGDNRDTEIACYNNMFWSELNGKTDIIYNPTGAMTDGAIDGYIMLSEDSFGNNAPQLNA